MAIYEQSFPFLVARTRQRKLGFVLQGLSSALSQGLAQKPPYSYLAESSAEPGDRRFKHASALIIGSAVAS